MKFLYVIFTLIFFCAKSLAKDEVNSLMFHDLMGKSDKFLINSFDKKKTEYNEIWGRLWRLDSSDLSVLEKKYGNFEFIPDEVDFFVLNGKVIEIVIYAKLNDDETCEKKIKVPGIRDYELKNGIAVYNKNLCIISLSYIEESKIFETKRSALQ